MALIPILKLGPVVANVIILLTALSSTLNIGADSSVINNLPILDGYIEFYDLDSALLGLNVAIVSAGLVVGGPFAGELMDRIGRTKALGIGNILSLVAVAIAGGGPNEASFAIGRFILGVAMSIALVASPLYLAELAAPHRRQTMVGILLSLVAILTGCFTLVVLGLYELGTMWAWRGYVFSEMIGPVIGLFFLLFAPETPRWLISKGRNEEALEILAHLHGGGDRNNSLVQLEFQEICLTLEAEKSAHSSWKGLITPAPNRRRFIISMLTTIFYQMLGGGNLLYFMTILLQMIGMTSVRDIILINFGIGINNMVALAVYGVFIDKVGRKVVLVWSTVIMSILMLIIALLQRQLEFDVSNPISIAAVVLIFVYEFSAMGWQILTYGYPNEILAYSQRAKGSCVVQSIGYAFSFVYLYCFPIALENITWKFFVINACWSFAFAIVVWFVFVETKGKTLEEVDEIFEGEAAVPWRLHPHENTEGLTLSAITANGEAKTPSQMKKELADQEVKSTI